MVRKKKKTTKNEWKKVSNEIEKEGIKRIKKKYKIKRNIKNVIRLCKGQEENFCCSHTQTLVINKNKMI